MNIISCERCGSTEFGVEKDFDRDRIYCKNCNALYGYINGAADAKSGPETEDDQKRTI
jgi:transcription initiation factor TFIIIB Brf1 subunit/transcription initiation factor TFIIB